MMRPCGDTTLAMMVVASTLISLKTTCDGFVSAADPAILKAVPGPSRRTTKLDQDARAEARLPDPRRRSWRGGGAPGAVEGACRSGRGCGKRGGSLRRRRDARRGGAGALDDDVRDRAASDRCGRCRALQGV